MAEAVDRRPHAEGPFLLAALSRRPELPFQTVAETAGNPQADAFPGGCRRLRRDIHRLSAGAPASETGTDSVLAKSEPRQHSKPQGRRSRPGVSAAAAAGERRIWFSEWNRRHEHDPPAKGLLREILGGRPRRVFRRRPGVCREFPQLDARAA